MVVAVAPRLAVKSASVAIVEFEPVERLVSMCQGRLVYGIPVELKAGICVPGRLVYAFPGNFS